MKSYLLDLAGKLLADLYYTAFQRGSVVKLFKLFKFWV